MAILGERRAVSKLIFTFKSLHKITAVNLDHLKSSNTSRPTRLNSSAFTLYASSQPKQTNLFKNSCFQNIIRVEFITKPCEVSPLTRCFQGLSLGSSVASPICQEGQSERTFPIFPFSSRFFLFFPDFSQIFGTLPPLPPQWLRHCLWDINTTTLIRSSSL